MFNVMIVDDEMIVRRGIRSSIDWEEHGIAIAAEARNGKEALEKLGRQPVDLILTDIRMPVMSGIELAKTVRSEYPDIEMVLLSGYEDFQYAKEAMSIGIRHYLLKPIIAEKLIAALSEIRDTELSRRLAKQGELVKTRLLNESLPLIKSKLMTGLIDNKPDTGDILDKAKTLGIDLSGPAYQIVAAEADGEWPGRELSRKQREAFDFAFLNIAEETLVSRFPGFASIAGPGRLTGLVNLRPDESALSVCRDIQSNLLRYLRLSVSIGIGRPVRQLADIAASWDEAVKAVRNKAFHGKGAILVCGEEEAAAAAAGHARKLVGDVLRYAAAHYDKPLGLAEAAGHVSVTPAYLSKVFKDEMGVTFIKWLNGIRVEEAKRLLAHTRMKTYEIAKKVGCPDYKYFSFLFKRHTGCSPMDFRNRQARE
ncbi:response regulator [Paenibacillus humicola]|uniref:response regulator n=1 Tax=Paenibacillus humicola TaxID=3110540 RepID=UPI00237A2AF9|nr:response regulator [Paenibacillus humicola]